MRTVTLLALLLTATFQACGEEPSLEEQLNSLWKQKKRNEIATLLESRIDVEPPDVAALHCCKFCFLVISPDKEKAMRAATKLMKVAEATRNARFIAFAMDELEVVSLSPAGDFHELDAEAFEKLHALFPGEYPIIFMSVGLRSFLKPPSK